MRQLSQGYTARCWLPGALSSLLSLIIRQWQGVGSFSLRSRAEGGQKSDKMLSLSQLRQSLFIGPGSQDRKSGYRGSCSPINVSVHLQPSPLQVANLAAGGGAARVGKGTAPASSLRDWAKPIQQKLEVGIKPHLSLPCLCSLHTAPRV